MKKLITAPLKAAALLIVLGLTVNTFAQNIDFKAANFKEDKEGLKKAEAAIELGDASFKLGMEQVFLVKDYGLHFKKALKQYEIAQKFNPKNGLLNYKIGVCHANSTDPALSIPYIKKARELDASCDPFLDYYWAYALQLEGKYKEAAAAYNTFDENYRKADDFKKFINLGKQQCTAAEKLQAAPLRAWVDNVSELNSAQDDLAPGISTDGAEMIFSSKRSNGHPANEIGEFDFDIYSTSLIDGKWGTPAQLKGPINSTNDDVSNCLSYDGNKMLIHREENGLSDIWESKLSGVNWSDPKKLPFNVSGDKTIEKYAAYSHDGWKVYFNREMAGSSGLEIVSSGMQNKMRQDYGVASKPGPVNTPFNEGPIYVAIDGETMYIASKGPGSMGGYDIFICKKGQSEWGAPVNMGYPINTPYDDFFFASTANGKFAYIASNRDGGKGGFDIYRVTFWGPEKKPVTETEDYLLASVAQPMKDHAIEKTVDVKKKTLTVFKGVTIDALTRKPVEAQIEIIDNGTGQVIETFTTNSATGKFIITLNSGKNYGIAVKATNYLFHSENFDIPMGADDALVNKTIELKNIAIGSKIALRNIFFDVGKATLRSESNAELERLVKLMKDVPNLKIEISGHTDNTGSATVNETLSQQRAEAVVSYLTAKGIAANRMTARGYGSAKPVASNNSEDGRQQNRRTEFEIKGN